MVPLKRSGHDIFHRFFSLLSSPELLALFFIYIILLDFEWFMPCTGTYKWVDATNLVSLKFQFLVSVMKEYSRLCKILIKNTNTKYSVRWWIIEWPTFYKGTQPKVLINWSFVMHESAAFSSAFLIFYLLTLMRIAPLATPDQDGRGMLRPQSCGRILTYFTSIECIWGFMYPCPPRPIAC